MVEFDTSFPCTVCGNCDWETQEKSDKAMLVECGTCGNIEVVYPKVTVIKGAVIDETKQYRYSLWRIWDTSKPKITFVMLNGSTADAENDDPTLRRCIGFAQKWGYGSLEVVNLFGFRTTLPSELKAELYPIGEENEKHIIASLKDADKVILAWGTHGKYMNQNQKVERLLKQHGAITYCLGVTSGGYPKHPLYLKNDTVPIRYIL